MKLWIGPDAPDATVDDFAQWGHVPSIPEERKAAMTYCIHPVLLNPGRVAPDADAAAVRANLQRIQAWFEGQGVPLLLLDPKTPECAEPWEWFAETPGGAFYGAQAWAVQRGYTAFGCQALILLDGYPDGHGEAGLSVAVVGYGVVADLAAGGVNADSAAGLLAHEVGHLLGLGHIQVPRELMSDQAWWQSWPNVGLAVKPAGAWRPAAPEPVTVQEGAGA